jgi:hypothetical protein
MMHQFVNKQSSLKLLGINHGVVVFKVYFQDMALAMNNKISWKQLGHYVVLNHFQFQPKLQLLHLHFGLIVIKP